jgi:uncharacterized protein YPO0396
MNSTGSRWRPRWRGCRKRSAVLNQRRICSGSSASGCAKSLAALKALETQLEEQRDKRSRIEQRQSDASALREQTQALLLDPKMAAQTPYFERLEAVRREALGEHQLSVESCENRQQETRVWLQTRMDAEARKLNLLRDRIIQAMVAYKEEFKLDTAEVDASIEAVFEYRNMLDKLQADDLPRFERASRNCSTRTPSARSPTSTPSSQCGARRSASASRASTPR